MYVFGVLVVDCKIRLRWLIYGQAGVNVDEVRLEYARQELIPFDSQVNLLV
jgi:hypothetical protein